MEGKGIKEEMMVMNEFGGWTNMGKRRWKRNERELTRAAPPPVPSCPIVASSPFLKPETHAV